MLVAPVVHCTSLHLLLPRLEVGVGESVPQAPQQRHHVSEKLYLCSIAVPFCGLYLGSYKAIPQQELQCCLRVLGLSSVFFILLPIHRDQAQLRRRETWVAASCLWYLYIYIYIIYIYIYIYIYMYIYVYIYIYIYNIWSLPYSNRTVGTSRLTIMTPHIAGGDRTYNVFAHLVYWRRSLLTRHWDRRRYILCNPTAVCMHMTISTVLGNNAVFSFRPSLPLACPSVSSETKPSCGSAVSSARARKRSNSSGLGSCPNLVNSMR